jgi:hypothetical protein
MKSIRWGDVNQIEGAGQNTTLRDTALLISGHGGLGRRIPIPSMPQGDAMNRSISLFTLCVAIAVASVFALVAWSGGYEATTELAHAR